MLVCNIYAFYVARPPSYVHLFLNVFDMLIIFQCSCYHLHSIVCLSAYKNTCQEYL